MAFITDNIQILGELEENALATTKGVTGERKACVAGSLCSGTSCESDQPQTFPLHYGPARF